ncbi:MAG: phosphoribosylglycinamide formyltransferase [Elusimicrobia bacterium]|nr:phosphoribosylglycinamide formyltransferase [Elusimicrobiota bacterium]
MPVPAIAVCCSGQGTNLQAIIEAVRSRRLRARISVVVSDNPRAVAILRARAARIPTVVIDPRRFSSKEAFDRSLSRIVEASGAKLIVLAGFMRILSGWFVRRYARRILNIHPALLPSFPGCHGARDALRHGVKVTGVTVHLVDSKVDHGPVLLQEPVPVMEGDTEETLLARIHRVEHRLYPRAIQRVLSGRVKVAGRRAFIR